MAALRSLLLACLAALLCGGQGGSHALPPEALGSASLACVRRGPAGGPALRARPAAHCGARGLLRGAAMRVAWIGPQGCVYYPVYELVQQVLRS